MRVHNTKFVCTLGPASESKKVLEKMIRNGMDVARLNFSHGTHKNHARLIKNIREVSIKLGVPVAIMQDLQGPKIRIGAIQDEGIEVKKNQKIILACGPNTKNKIPVQYKKLYKDVKKNDIILIDDGLIEIKVNKIKEKDIYCTVLNNGNIKKNKGINVPTATITTNPITPKDKKDLKFGLKHNVDYVALSFVMEAKNMHDLKKLIGNKNVKIVAKIERQEAVENLEEIIEASDALMVARGDLGMEIGPEKVPIVQKKMIHLCNLAGKPVITATHMLQSMINNPQPTRAEVSDSANAIFDHSDAIMLSNETAVGKYPIRAIKVFANIANIVEKELQKHHELLPIKKPQKDELDALGYEVCELAEKSKAKKIIIISKTVKSVSALSKHRTYIPTIVITDNEKTRNHLALLWGVNTVIINKSNKKLSIKDIKSIVLRELSAKKGEKIVIFYTDSKEKHIVSTVL